MSEIETLKKRLEEAERDLSTYKWEHGWYLYVQKENFKKLEKRLEEAEAALRHYHEISLDTACKCDGDMVRGYFEKWDRK